MTPETPPVPLLDLKAQFATIKDEVMQNVTQVFEQQAFILGSWVAEAEKALAEYLKVEAALGVASGTDALLLSLMALGIGPGDGVITTPFTFFATVGSIVRTGATPIFVDIDPVSFNLDVKALEALLEKGDFPARPKAVIPVHLFGQPAEMAPILALAEKHGLKVIEDGAQAIGAKYPDPAKGASFVGAMGDTGCFSFFPSKNLGAAGDGGLITTMDPELAVKLKSMRTHGSHPNEKYRHLYVGGNFRLDALQAAVVLAKLPHLADWSRARREHAAVYGELFTQSGLKEKGVELPERIWPELPESHIYNQFTIRAKDRDGLLKALQEAKVGCAIYYPIPLHLQMCFANLGYKQGDMPESEKAALEVLSLPVYPELTRAQQERVVSVIADFHK